MPITVDSTTEPVNLIWTCGDSQAQTFRLLTDPDTPWDLTGVTVNAQARSTLGAVTALPVQIDDPTTGVLAVHSPPNGLDPDVYDYDVQFGDGQQVATWIHGRIQVRKDVTP
jgi:hypothetical protein